MTTLEKSYNKRQEEWRLQWIQNQIQAKKNFIDVNYSSKVQRPKKINFIVVIITCLLVFVALLIVASFYDQQITRALSTWALPSIKTSPYYNESTSTLDITGHEVSIDNLLGRVYSYSVFASIIQTVGQFPMTFALVASLSVIFWNGFRINHKGGRITLQVVFCAIAFVFLFWKGYTVTIPELFQCSLGLENFNEYKANNQALYTTLLIVLTLVESAAVEIGFFIGFKHIKKDVMSQMLRWAMATILAIALTTAIYGLVFKNIFNRERFRFIYQFEQIAIVKYDGGVLSGIEFSNKFFGGYRDWYTLISNSIDRSSPYVFKDAIKSFPSGHAACTAAGALSIFILPLTVKETNTYKFKISVWTVVPIYIAIVAIGRIVAGAHYLSDTLFGILLAIILLFVFYFVVTWSCRFFDKWTNIQIYPYLQWEMKKRQLQ